MIEKLSNASMAGGSVTAVVSGGAKFLGLAPGEWQVVGVIGGLVIGALGLAFNTYFQWKRSQP